MWSNNSSSEDISCSDTVTPASLKQKDGRHKESNAQGKKQKLARDTHKRQIENEIKKSNSPKECMKFMHLEIHPDLAKLWYMADLSPELTLTGAKLDINSQSKDPGLIMWSRSVQQCIVNIDGQMTLSSSRQPSDIALYLCTADTVAEYVSSHMLAELVNEKKKLVQADLSLIIFGFKNYFKTRKRKSLKNGERKLMTEVELEMAITDVMVTTGCDTLIVNTANELALLLVQFTKAIAEAPYKEKKRSCDDLAQFYMRGDKKKSIAVNKDGAGLNRLWQQMLAVLPASSLETSRALSAKYRSPLELFEALQKDGAVQELSDIGVSRATVPGSKPRRIGPEFARKLNLLFTSEDGDVLIS